ncbi:hypothetical protein SAMN02982918_3758 [Saccharomonospora viridis]|nr:hypothetical protein SAMN02982918_3758 [Saccharomonospora viridis]
MRYKLSGTKPPYRSALRETGLIAVNAKKLASFAGIALVLFFVIARPTEAAGFVDSIITALRDAAEAVITFVSSVFS